jgi:hypothetical protein
MEKAMHKRFGREMLSIATIALAALVFALEISVSANAAAVPGDLLLLTVALCGAIVSGVNGFGRQMARAKVCSAASRKRTQREIALLS